MKKSHLIAMALLLAGGAMTITSCKGKADSKTEDSIVDSAQPAIAEIPVAERDSLAKIFDDPARKSDVATDTTYAVTESGLKYIVLKQGNGESPKATDIVKVNYEGRLTTGYVFDSSYQRGEPATFPLNAVIAGWTEGLQLMKTGGVNIFYIPGNLAYGEQGAPQAGIGPNEPLIFKVELIDIEK